MDFYLNLPFDDMKDFFLRAKVGLHTMLDEHFGICVVELMAAGLVTIAHNSAGPKLDIIGDSNLCGFLATTPQEYAERMHLALTQWGSSYIEQMRVSAKDKVQKFEDARFMREFRQVTQIQ